MSNSNSVSKASAQNANKEEQIKNLVYTIWQDNNLNEDLTKDDIEVKIESNGVGFLKMEIVCDGYLNIKFSPCGDGIWSESLLGRDELEFCSEVLGRRDEIMRMVA